VTPTGKDEDARHSDNDTLLAFDFGLRRTGVAVGNRRHGSASALTTLAGSGDGPEFDAIAGLLHEWRPCRLIVGRPTHMDGSENEMTRRAERFARRLAGRFGLPVDMVDERLTSVEAQDMIRSARRAGRKRRARAADVDKLSAQVILRSWLEQQQGGVASAIDTTGK